MPAPRRGTGPVSCAPPGPSRRFRFTNTSSLRSAKNSANPYSDYTRGKLVKLLAKDAPTGAAGEKYVYSNLAVGLLGHALVNAAKADSFDSLVKERVCKPLKLKDTGEALTGEQKSRLAVGHTEDGKKTDSWDFATLEACGGLRSSATDMLTFAAANCAGSKSPLAEVLAESHKKREGSDVKGVDVGLCWHLQKLPNGEPVVWHNGGTGGYASMLAITPATGRAVVVLAAVADRRVDALALEVLAKVPPK